MNDLILIFTLKSNKNAIKILSSLFSRPHHCNGDLKLFVASTRNVNYISHAQSHGNDDIIILTKTFTNSELK